MGARRKTDSSALAAGAGRRQPPTFVFISLGIVVLAAVVRLGALSQSLWYDEMYTLLHYVLRPWGETLAGRESGQYSPNNHVLFTLLAKLATWCAGSPADVGELTVLIRLPSLVAGALAAVALAWPMRRRPIVAAIIGVIAALHPWLVSLSTWARGYALLMLLSVVGTILLPGKNEDKKEEGDSAATKDPGGRGHDAGPDDVPGSPPRRPRIAWRYVLTMAAALYTQPIALAVFAGHGLSMAVLRRDTLWTWLRSAALAGVLAGCFYLPLLNKALAYWGQPQRASIGYGQFIEQSLRYAHAGENTGGIAYLAVPVVLLVAGGILAWRRVELRPLVLTFAGAAAFGAVLPLVAPAVGEVRAMLWLIPLYCIGAAAIVSVPFKTWRLRAVEAIAGVMLLISLGMGVDRIAQVPAQPIAEGIAAARELAGPGSGVIGIYMASVEAKFIYGRIDAMAYRLGDEPLAPGEPELALRSAEAVSGRSPVGIVFYEDYLRRDRPELWQYLQMHYTLVKRLPGRISGVGIYRRHE